MIHGIGVDLLRVERIAAVHARHGARFEVRVLHASERAALLTARDAANFIAKSFAAKEAFGKALGTGIRDFAHTDLGVVRNDPGRPSLVFTPSLTAALAARGVTNAHLSLSDDGGWVCAFVVLESGAASTR